MLKEERANLISENEELYGKVKKQFWSFSMPRVCSERYVRIVGWSSIPGKMLLVRIIENNKDDAYFRSGKVSLAGLGKGLYRAL